MADDDGLDEAAEQILRVGLTAAAQLAEHLAQARTQSQRDAAARSDREARDLAGRIETERRAADAQLTRTRDPRWIATATAGEVTDAYATARQWAGTDPAAARDAQRILDQVRARYGPDAVSPGRDPAADLSTGGRADSPALRAARADAALLLAAPDVDARVQSWLAKHPGPLPGLTPTQTVEAVNARVRAALFQATPATDATAARSAGAGERARPATPVADVTRTAEAERG
jgi:hypothetical protein